MRPSQAYGQAEVKVSRDRPSDELTAHPVQAEVDNKVFVVFHEFVCVGRDVLVLWWTSEDSPDS